MGLAGDSRAMSPPEGAAWSRWGRGCHTGLVGG